MVATVAGIHLGLDTHGNRPAGNSCPDGSTYSCSTHGLIYKSNYAGNSWATWATLGTTGAIVDPMTTRGDVIVRNSSNTTARLGVGAAGKFLTSDGTDVAYGQGPLTTTGDLIIGATGGTPTRLAAGATSGHVLTSNGSAAAPSWQAAAAGGGGTQSYLGYNTVGASFETLPASRQYMKKITVAATCQLQNVGLHLKVPSATDIARLYLGLWDDTGATAPGLIRAFVSSGNFGLKNGAAARWVEFPLAAKLTAADYWIGFVVAANGSSSVQIAYDTGGSDPYLAAGDYIIDGNYAANTNSTRQYSIRTSILT